MKIKAKNSYKIHPINFTQNIPERWSLNVIYHDPGVESIRP